MKLGINGRFYGPRVTGVQRFAREVSQRLYDREDVVVFLPRSRSRPAGLPESVPVVEGRLRGHLWEQLELPTRVREERVDVVLHLAGTGSTWGGRNVVVVYDVTPLSHPEWFTRAFRTWFRVSLGEAARRAAGVLTISEWSRREVERVLGIDPERVRVISQGLDPFVAPAPAEAVALARSRWKLPDRFLLALGGRNPRKNVRFLLGMLGRWAREPGGAPTLVIAGEEYSWLHSADELRLRGDLDVRFLGHVPDADLHALYSAATAFCFPSLAEGFGRPPLEAMACGTPAVVADYGCAAEVLRDGAIILPLDEERWIEALAGILSDPAVRGGWSGRGRAHAARYRWDDAIDVLVDVCRSAARNGGG